MQALMYLSIAWMHLRLAMLKWQQVSGCPEQLLEKDLANGEDMQSIPEVRAPFSSISSTLKACYYLKQPSYGSYSHLRSFYVRSHIANFRSFRAICMASIQQMAYIGLIEPMIIGLRSRWLVPRSANGFAPRRAAMQAFGALYGSNQACSASLLA